MTLNYNLIYKKPVLKKGTPFRIKLNGLDFGFEKKLYAKIFTMSQRITKKHPVLDACLVNSGYEGDGKTNTSLIEAIIAQKLIGTSIHLFFKTSSCIDFAKKTEKKIIILDEPSFETLSTDSSSNLSKDFLRLTSTMRKKRHFFIINFAKFWKFPEFLVIDRALGMVHMDSKNGKRPGRFVYIRKKRLEDLWNGKKKSNKLLFTKVKAFGGQLPYLMEDIFDRFNIQVESVHNASMEDYDREKDRAIESIGEEKKEKKVNKVQAGIDKRTKLLRKRVALLWKKGKFTKIELAKHLGVKTNRLSEWAQLDVDENNEDKNKEESKE